MTIRPNRSCRRCRGILFVALSLVVIGPVGCGGSSPYPEARVTNAVGAPSVCAYCGKPISTVAESNLLTVQGVRYVICDEKCSAQQTERALHQ